MFFIKAKDLEERTALLDFLKANGIGAVFHYIPLHSSLAGKKLGVFHGEDKRTTKESERIVRLPLYYGLKSEEVDYICSKVKEFYKKK
jgi:dTDP-4-amino-4,6-dideoxygalactose transaminase